MTYDSPARENTEQACKWAAEAIPKVWHRASLREFAALKGDASSRRFWRAFISSRRPGDPKTAIVIDLGPEDLPLYARALNWFPAPPSEPPFLNVHRFMESFGAAVPELYYSATPAQRMLMVEDVGETPLLEAAARGDTADLYRMAVAELLKIHVEGTRRIGPGCVASTLAYDERLFRWELEQFVEFGIEFVGTGSSARHLEPELDELAALLGRLPRVFSHRDYHGNNLFLADGRIRVIDFQDALMAPAAQDLAVLLTTRDTGRLISPADERRLLSYYLAGLWRREAPALPPAEFEESYRLCVLQHALKVIGRFSYLEIQGKPGYRVYIPHALAQARRALDGQTRFPVLRRALAV